MPENSEQISKSVELAAIHYRYNGLMGNMPGVEQVMSNHAEALDEAGITNALIVGETNIEEKVLPQSNIEIILYRPLRMDEEHLSLTNPQQAALLGGKISKGINALTPDAKTIFHNPLLGWRYNAGYGKAAAQTADASTQGRRATSVLWVHDADGTPNEVYEMLPKRDGAKIAIVSIVRREALLQLFNEMTKIGLQVPEFDIRVIPNSLNATYFNENITSPQTLNEIAPNFEMFTKQESLPQSNAIVENLLFSDNDTIKLLLPARPIHNKGVIESIQVAQELTKISNQKVALFVTNAPDRDMAINEQSWENIKTFVRNNQNKNLYVIFLGGAQSKFMKWLYTRSDLLVAPFENEGFGLPPAEAALCGLKSVISDDPALQETTQGHAKVIEQTLWKSEPRTVAKLIYDYLGLGENEDVAKLQAFVREHYSPKAATIALTNIMDIKTP